jgi:hypothetical protein
MENPRQRMHNVGVGSRCELNDWQLIGELLLVEEGSLEKM